MSRARFGVLGRLEVLVADAPLYIKAPQLRRLLCMLLLSPGRQVSHPTLVECMWPDEGALEPGGPSEPTRALRVYASRLRRVLPLEVGPHSEAGGYRIDVDADDVDAHRFEALAAEGRAYLRHDPAQASSSLRAALDLWRGSAFGEFCEEPWAVGPAVRLEERRLATIELLVDARLSLGEHAGLCAELEHLVDEHPLRERFWAQLILALYRSGRQADALRAYQRLRKRLGEELGIEPSRELADLETLVLRQDATLDLPDVIATSHRAIAPVENAAAREGVGVDTPAESEPRKFAGRDHLPVQRSSFVGRETEKAEVLALVSGARMVTLTGPGGAGKTRLALQVAEDMFNTAGSEIRLVELAGLRDPNDLASTVASALGVKTPPGSTVLDGLVEALRGERMLLLIDNCEHLVSACAELCDALLRSCRVVSILTTSREPICVEGEILYRVPSLGLPSPGAGALEDVGAEDAVRLFVERARTQLSYFELDTSNAALVASLCRQLDGMPLALELAAARLRSLSLTQIHDRLDERFRLLVSGTRSNPPRQRTLEATIDWSYELLDSSERSLLRSLSVFAGAFDLDAAEALIEMTTGTALGVLDGVTSLVDKSLVVADTGGETARYRLLETIRQYAFERLSAEDGPGALAAMRSAHAAIYLELAERAFPRLWTADQFVWIERLELEFDNIRLAFAQFLGDGGSTWDAIRLLVALDRFFDWCGHASERVAIVEALEGQPELDRPDRVAVWASFVMLRILGQNDPANPAARRLEEGLLSRAKEAGDAAVTALALGLLAWRAWEKGDYPACEKLQLEALETARASGEYLVLHRVLNGAGASRRDRLEALELCGAAGDRIARYFNLANLAGDALVEGEIAVAREYLEEALTIADRNRPGGADGNMLNTLGAVLVLEGRHEVARPFYVRSIRRGFETRHFANGLLGVAWCDLERGELAKAATLYGAAERHLEAGGFALELAERRLAEEGELRLRSGLGDESFEALVTRGRSLGKEEAADLALGRPSRL